MFEWGGPVRFRASARAPIFLMCVFSLPPGPVHIWCMLSAFRAGPYFPKCVIMFSASRADPHIPGVCCGPSARALFPKCMFASFRSGGLLNHAQGAVPKSSQWAPASLLQRHKARNYALLCVATWVSLAAGAFCEWNFAGVASRSGSKAGARPSAAQFGASAGPLP